VYLDPEGGDSMFVRNLPNYTESAVKTSDLLYVSTCSFVVRAVVCPEQSLKYCFWVIDS
jgi:hypothetical protein